MNFDFTPMTHETLHDIAQQIEATGKPRSLTVRQLLAAIGQERRGKHVTLSLYKQLRRNRLKCEPDFSNTHIDGTVTLTLGPKLGRPLKSSEAGMIDVGDLEADGDPEPQGTELPESSPSIEVTTSTIVATSPAAEAATAVEVDVPQAVLEAREVVITVRQGIPAAGMAPALIRKQECVFRALSQMNDMNVSQLVVANSERGMVDGIVSWRSYGKAILAGKKCETVSDCLSRDFVEMRDDKPLFDAVREVIRHGTIVVRARDNTLCGLVTQRDIAEVFVELSEPFLFLGQIENHLRELVERMHLTRDELKLLADGRDPVRAARARRVDDLTLGELIRAFQNPEYWKKLGIKHDRSIILQRLERVRQIRNKVMHFDADKLPEEEKRYLTDTRRILQEM